MKIIAIAGKMRSGKDVLASILQERTGFEIVKFADPVKNTVCTILNCTREDLQDRKFIDTPIRFNLTQKQLNIPGKVWTPRKLQQFIGTDVGRNMIDPDIWIYSLNKTLNPSGNYIISDMRFMNEYDYCAQHDFFSIYILRSPQLRFPEFKNSGIPNFEDWVKSEGMEEVIYHESETGFDFLQKNKVKDNRVIFSLFDHIILNDFESVEELKNSFDNAWKNIVCG